MGNPCTTRRSTSVGVCRIESLLKAEDPTLVDLRSPSEYAEDHLPGARNVPLFDDVERAVIGTLYRRTSPETAFAEGRRYVHSKLHDLMLSIARAAGDGAARACLQPELLEERLIAMTQGGMGQLEAELEASVVAELPARPLILHCWRGGLRSRSVVALARKVGFADVFGLEGGYKAFRRHVLATIADWNAPQGYVLRGLTGVGKTLVLRALERLRPGWGIDLEELAGHRSSLLGMVGLEPCSQKSFETRLFERLQRGFEGPVVFEGESRKVGDAVIPAAIWEPLQAATNIELVADEDYRVQVLLEDYLAQDENRAPLREQLTKVEARMSQGFGHLPPCRRPLVELFDQGRERELVKILLADYYDPLYRHSEGGRNYEISFDSSDPERAAGEIVSWIEEPGRIEETLDRIENTGDTP